MRRLLNCDTYLLLSFDGAKHRAAFSGREADKVKAASFGFEDFTYHLAAIENLNPHSRFENIVIKRIVRLFRKKYWLDKEAYLPTQTP